MKQKLFILQGAPGSGKSTFIRRHNIESLVISSDSLRSIVTSNEVDLDGVKLPKAADKKVWNFLYSILEERFKSFSNVVVDATHTAANSMNKYIQMALSLGYEIIVIKFDVSLEDCQKRNLMRSEASQVPPEVVERKWHEVQNFKYRQEVKVVLASQVNEVGFLNMFGDKHLELSSYKNVLFIGDIQGCYDSLIRLLEQYDLRETFLVFCGDLTDRGLQNWEVVSHCLKLDSRNCLFIRGNHDNYSEAWFWDKEVTAKFFCTTGDEYAAQNLDDRQKHKLRKFYSNFQLYRHIRIHDQEFFVCHGGISRYLSPEECFFISGDSFIRGSGRYEEHIQSDTSFIMNSDNIIQVRGHRNVDFLETEFSVDGYSSKVFILEGKVEFNLLNVNHESMTDKGKIIPNGRLRALHVGDMGIKVIEVE